MGMFKVLSRPSQPIQKPNIASGLAAHGEKAQRLNATGQDGTATITAVRDTAVTVGDNPSIEMDLQVQVAGAGPPYPVTHEQVVSRHSVGNFQPGASVVVKVDPEDPESIFVA